MNTTTSRWLLLVLAATAPACVGSDLEVPENHPGHPAARAGKPMHAAALGADSDLAADEAAPADSAHSGHEPEKADR